MVISEDLHQNFNKLPYNGEKLEFIARNMKIPVKRVLDVLAMISVNSDDLVVFLVNERIKNRKRQSDNYSSNFYR